MKEFTCPKCLSTNIYRSKKFSAWICEDCGERFEEESVPKKWNQGLLRDEYWNQDLIKVAPVSLAVSYQQLYNYVSEGNIGSTLFLIRDVFELMIKIPVVILLDGIYKMLDQSDDVDQLLNDHPKFKQLYGNSLQILTTGKWWECVRLATILPREFADEALFSDESEFAYRVTLEYLQKIYKMFSFQVPGQPKVSIISWRNRAVGHSCLVTSNPEENYAEIPYILIMLQKIAAVSVPYYKKVSLTNENKTLLRGLGAVDSGNQIFIAYCDESGWSYNKIHSFVAGKSENLAYYDGYEKGKAYLLSYADGDRYKDQALSQYLEQISTIGGRAIFSDNSVDMDNLETLDIKQLEDELSATESGVITIPCLYEWLMNETENTQKGILLLQAERGMGKSTFCETINQLSDSDNVLRFSDAIDGWTEFMENTAIRVWHFNSTYYGRPDIYIEGIKDAVLTMVPGHFENKRWIESNRLAGRLTSMWENLKDCETNLRHVYFAEVLNATAEEYFSRTEKERLILVMDGVDELQDAETLMSYIPNSSELNEGVFILLASRTDEELSGALADEIIFRDRACMSSLEFTRNHIVCRTGATVREEIQTNSQYHQAVAQYVRELFPDKKEGENTELVNRFESRFSELAAYRTLCRMSPLFKQSSGSDLLTVFVDVLRANAPEHYLKKVEMILNALVWSGSALTIRELAYLSGEQYVSYRFIGMLYDLRAFIRVIRTDKGNCYEFSHAEWEVAVKGKYPYGGIYFRALCNRLLDEIEEQQVKELFEEKYQGELWLLSNMLRIYNQAYAELKENWFEEIKVDKVSNLWVEYIKKQGAFERLDLSATKTAYILETIAAVWNDYDKAISTFSSFDYTGRCCAVDDSAKSPMAHALISNISVSKISDKWRRSDFDHEMPGAYESIGRIYDRLAVRCSDKKMKERLALLADKCYMQAMYLYNTKKKQSVAYVAKVIKNCYEAGRICQIAELTDRAKHWYEVGLKGMLKTGSVVSKSIEFLGAKLCTRYALLLEDENEKYDYYISAERFLEKLVLESDEPVYRNFRTWLFRLTAEWHLGKGEYTKAIQYFEKALEDARVVYGVRGLADDISDVITILFSLAKVFEKVANYEKLMEVAKDLVNIDRERVRYLKWLSLAYDQLKLSDEKDEIDNRIHQKEQEDELWANAYQEVLEILKYTERESVNKIPQDKVLMWQKRANPNHGFRVDVNKSFDEQGMMEETRAIFANIFRDYWATDKQKSKIIEHEERDRLEYKVKLLLGILKRTCDYSGTMEIGKMSPVDDRTFDEIDKIMQSIPRKIALCIPLDVRVEIIRRKTHHYDKEFLYEDDDFYPESIAVVKYLIEKHVPASVLEDEIESVPEDFDLSVIFDNPDYED